MIVKLNNKDRFSANATHSGVPVRNTLSHKVGKSKKKHPIVKESIGTIFPSKRSNYQDKNMKMYLNIEISMGIVFRFFVRHGIHVEQAI